MDVEQPITLMSCMDRHVHVLEPAQCRVSVPRMWPSAGKPPSAVLLTDCAALQARRSSSLKSASAAASVKRIASARNSCRSSPCHSCCVSI